MDSLPNQDQILAHTRRWVERWVIRENLCPFAGPVNKQGLLEYRISFTTDQQELMEAVEGGLAYLESCSPEECETLILVHPAMLRDFRAYLDFVALAEEYLFMSEREGIFQIASFHPRYQFEGTDPDSAENYTNRSPYPMLHFLREASVSRAVDSLDDPEAIPNRNIEHLQEMGPERILAIMKAIEMDSDT